MVRDWRWRREGWQGECRYKSIFREGKALEATQSAIPSLSANHKHPSVKNRKNHWKGRLGPWFKHGADRHWTGYIICLRPNCCPLGAYNCNDTRWGKAPQFTECKMLTDLGENYSWVSAINTLGYPIVFWQLVINPSLRRTQVNVLIDKRPW